MMERIVEFWYAIPRESEWWFDQIGRILSGCSTGCFVFLGSWFLSTVLMVALCMVVARNANEGLSMGAAWGCPLGLVNALVFGSLALAAISKYREG